MNPQASSQHPPATPGAADTDPASLRALLSALADGEAEADGTRQACAAFRDDAEARRTWHSYQLIGDVLRSDELASRPGRDAAFLAGLRERLAQEPVVLAPEPLPQLAASPVAAPVRRQPRWLTPAAVAAGFVVVAGVLVVTRTSAPDAAGPSTTLAGGPPTAQPAAPQSAWGPGLPSAVVTAPALAPNFTLATGPAVVSTSPGGAAMLRDAQLDLYLNAHQAARRGGAVALPGTALRSVEIVIPADIKP